MRLDPYILHIWFSDGRQRAISAGYMSRIDISPDGRQALGLVLYSNAWRMVDTFLAKQSHQTQSDDQQSLEGTTRNKTHLSTRLFDAVNKKCGTTGFTLTLPTFWSESWYQRALSLSSRRSRCVASFLNIDLD